ncbi:Phox domain-containing protein [Hibiscus syriacus]|uniref:Phox domain-containing protein n=1 Tax=Hibiscus syriacus TaxID=106335 RepID=A0A6A3CAG6_HIBSY|nr:Phox domain-containing protein [Hibiscus syriacus]
MINGKGTCENNLAQVASADPLDLSHLRSDGASTASSPHYSSCGESQFERYCSANSVLGTPSSIATFNDCFGESEFGSVRSISGFALGDDFESFSLEGNPRVPSNRIIEFGKDRIEEGSSSCLDVNLRKGDGNLSRYEQHSEGTDSSYNYGTDDDECKNNSYYRKKEDENKNVNENPLGINSSVAFGGNDWDDFEQEVGMDDLASFMLDASIARKKVQGGDELQENFDTSGVFPSGFSSPGETEFVEVKDISVAEVTVEEAKCYFLDAVSSPMSKDIPITRIQLQDADDDVGYLQTCSVTDVFAMDPDPQVEKAPVDIGLNVVDSDRVRQHQSSDAKEFIAVDESKLSERQEIDKCKAELDALNDCVHPVDSPQKANAELYDDCKPDAPISTSESVASTTLKNRPVPVDEFEEHSGMVKMKNLELNEFYDEVVHDMEEILLDSVDSPGAMFSQGNSIYQPQLPLPPRDGGSNPSTSGADDAHLHSARLLRIDHVEVVGAKQKKGNVSFSERLVGVKEYTVYKIRVWTGNDQWEIERRYRDFCTLHRRLKSTFSEQGWILPPPWSSVETESRKLFGNASPDVVSERSVLIQECLRSIIYSRFSSNPPSSLIWFLSPQDAFPGIPPSNTNLSQTALFSRGRDTKNSSPLGKTISLIVEIRAPKSTKQMLETQHYTCAGCHKHFDEEMTLLRDLVQSIGWGKPRLCEYTGQLFCSSCHTNEMAVLPARALHHWDFTRYPVSQLAKSYLDSIRDQPMLCVSAVNPFLFSKVPALNHVMGIRKKIGKMLPYVHCPFRMSINKGLGSRRYLLECNDFFALRDLIDLSKGAFAALPVMVETVSRKIEEHIVEQCLICEIEKCMSCGSVFHKTCFKMIANCPCGALLRADEAMRGSSSSIGGLSFGANGTLGSLGKRSSGELLPVGFLSRLFSKTKQEGMEHKDNENTILMGSLPGSYL